MRVLSTSRLSLLAAGLAALVVLPGCVRLPDLGRPGGLSFRGCPAEYARSGGPTFGTLTYDDCVEDRDRAVDYYVLDIDRPGEFEIRLGSDEFDAYLYLFDEYGDLLERDDDITPILNTDAKITRYLPRGRYFVGAAGLNRDDLGRYRLDIRYRR